MQIRDTWDNRRDSRTCCRDRNTCLWVAVDTGSTVDSRRATEDRWHSVRPGLRYNDHTRHTALSTAHVQATVTCTNNSSNFLDKKCATQLRIDAHELRRCRSGLPKSNSTAAGNTSYLYLFPDKSITLAELWRVCDGANKRLIRSRQRSHVLAVQEAYTEALCLLAAEPLDALSKRTQFHFIRQRAAAPVARQHAVCIALYDLSTVDWSRYPLRHRPVTVGA